MEFTAGEIKFLKDGSKVDRILRDYRNGYSAEHIARYSGKNAHEIRAVLRNHGVKIRRGVGTAKKGVSNA